jgi:hypothetical protein
MAMRIERTGPIEPLTPRVEKFIVSALRGVSLDHIVTSQNTRPDYSCLGDLVAIELKTLEDDGKERIDNLVSELLKRPDWPKFLGSAPIQSFINNTSDPDGLGKKVLERIGRGILRPMQKANRQLEAHAQRNRRKNLVKILFLVNEDHETYDPHTVSYVLWHAVRREEPDGQPRFGHIDSIVYFTERHGIVINNLLTYPVISIHGHSTYEHPWKADVVDFIQNRWLQYCGHPDASLPSEVAISDFTTISHIPEKLRNQDRWIIDYQRNPYFSEITTKELRDRFDEITLVNTLGFLKNPPIIISDHKKLEFLQYFTHIMHEMAQRAIPIDQFPYDPARAVNAAKRLRLPLSVQAWITSREQNKN